MVFIVARVGGWGFRGSKALEFGVLGVLGLRRLRVQG